MIISKEELQKLYNNNKNEEVCKKLEISMPTLLKLLKENGIELKGSGNPYHKNKVQVVK